MDIFEMADLISEQGALGERYLEFFTADTGTLSLGLYVLPADDDDPQQPHTEDEIYYVVSGSGMLRVGDEDRQVRAGTVVFVETAAPHKFHSITETLTLLVVFAPPRRSRA
ncbi:MAG: cupin domain-containing protein [Chloroflexota bacterium]|nr:cupin domain-containing protein [Chloroflexota bacterium]MCY3637760.1 cupin domain-containing protein [Chloroflexota bacterium]MDE2685922.1 cupin domain-containing protein [Chloroflexota bacterium]